MINEKDKYKADVLKVSGFAVMSPFGIIVIKMFDEAKLFLDLDHIIAFLISLLLLCCGIIIVSRGLIHLE